MKKGMHTYVALILIVMIILAAMTAAFYWIVKVQGNMQAGTEEYKEELTGQITRQVDIISFDYNSSNDNATIIMRNIGSEDIKNVGRKEDSLVITSKDSSCDMWFNGSNCNVCPFDLDVNKIKSLSLTFSNTGCTGLSSGVQHTANFYLEDTSVYTQFIAE